MRVLIGYAKTYTIFSFKWYATPQQLLKKNEVPVFPRVSTKFSSLYMYCIAVPHTLFVFLENILCVGKIAHINFFFKSLLQTLCFWWKRIFFKYRASKIFTWRYFKGPFQITYAHFACTFGKLHEHIACTQHWKPTVVHFDRLVWHCGCGGWSSHLVQLRTCPSNL